MHRIPPNPNINVVYRDSSRHISGGVPRWDNAPQAHSRGLNINFNIWIWGYLCISHEKYIKDGKILAHFGLRLKVLLGSLTDLTT
jgi:hypothetical protein